MGVINWMAAFQSRMMARAEVGMQLEGPSPLKDAKVRAALRTRNMPLIEEGIAGLETALAIDPEYEGAMDYMNLLYREKADLEDSVEAYEADTELADQWVDKTLAMKKLNADLRAYPAEW